MARPKTNEEDKKFNRTVCFDPHQYERLEKYCIDEERTASWVIRKALEEFLEKKGY